MKTIDERVAMLQKLKSTKEINKLIWEWVKTDVVKDTVEFSRLTAVLEDRGRERGIDSILHRE